ncbi:acylphosphatase [Specibacter sp. RAF43]|uniref:acylphosphatase n=1 Tax=Specibacter sp. RAF43 TaxID=3233057 RepID=UPI003F99FA91
MRDEEAAGPAAAVRLTAVVHGTVQGVGFRYLAARKARELSLAGSAVNRNDGTVEVIAEGPPESVRALLDWLESPEAPGVVTTVEAAVGPAGGHRPGFQTG